MTATAPRTLAGKLLADHLLDGELRAGTEVGLAIDQALVQDATGTLIMLELEAMGIDRVRTELAVQYVDHNLLQADSRNADDHAFLRSAAKRFGLWFSKPGNGVSHAVHMQRFGVPGKTLLGSDSHTCAAGSLGMLAIGTGGLDVALAMAGEPFRVVMPEIFGVELSGTLPDWVSAKDVILELLRRHGVDGATNRIVEYHGPGVDTLSAMDRHVIANMGAELGATTTVFPSDDRTRRFLESEGRGQDFVPLAADDGAAYDVTDSIDLGTLVPLIAEPSSPGKVVPVTEVAGREIGQAVIGSSANPGLRDFAVAAEIVAGAQVDERVSLDINPTSRQTLEALTRDGWLADLISAGARIHQAGCMGCIGMGQAPATDTISLRTMPRNFPGRSGTPEDQVYLCSPETAAVSALRGVITDPRTAESPYPGHGLSAATVPNTDMLVPPPATTSPLTPLVKGPNIGDFPTLDELPDTLECEVLLAVGDDVSTDEISPAGARVLPYRSNIARLAEFSFEPIDPTYARRAAAHTGQHAIVGGRNYGQGSSREHAALAPRSLGLRVVLARSFARIHWQNLANFGVLPLELADGDGPDLTPPVEVRLPDVRERLRTGAQLVVEAGPQATRVPVRHHLSPRQIEAILDGGVLRAARRRV